MNNNYGKLDRIYEKAQFIEQARKMLDNHGAGYYVLSNINIDNFKLINSKYGTSTGNDILQHLADNLVACMDDVGGIAGHISGDDFVLIYPVTASDSARMQHGYKAAVNPDCVPQKLHIRIGRYIINTPSLPIETIYSNAKIAANSIRGSYEKVYRVL